MMDVSDTYILPVVGYRGWVLREGKLSSYAVDNFWIPKKANVAQCGGYEHVKFWGSHKIHFGPKLIPHASYVAPLAECGCGFYAFRTLPYLVEWLEHREPNIVVGEVNLWGKIVDCQYGYRAQYAYPKRFYSNSYEYDYACNNSNFALREFKVPIEPMPETVIRGKRPHSLATVASTRKQAATLTRLLSRPIRWRQLARLRPTGKRMK